MRYMFSTYIPPLSDICDTEFQRHLMRSRTMPYVIACDLPLSISMTCVNKLLSNKNVYDLGICCLL